MRIDLCTVTLEMKSRSNILTRTFFGEPTPAEIIAEFKKDWACDIYVYEALQECGAFNFATWQPIRKGSRQLTPTHTATYMKDRMCLATLTMTTQSIPFTSNGEMQVLQVMADERTRLAEEKELALV